MVAVIHSKSNHVILLKYFYKIKLVRSFNNFRFDVYNFYYQAHYITLKQTQFVYVCIFYGIGSDKKWYYLF